VWNRSLFPTATLIPLLVFGIGLEGLFVLLMGYEPRSPFLSFTWSQARLAGAAFAIVLALSYLVQGRAGASLGSGYVILSLSTVASFAGAVLTRRAELARGSEEITVPAEHPWRAAFLRWRRELTAKVNSYAAGRREPAQPSPPTETMPSLPGEEPDSTSEIETPDATPVPRLSAVQSEPEPDEEPAADGDEPTTDGEKPAAAEETAGEGEAAAGGEVAVAAAAETEASADDKAEGETERDDEEPERERPAAPG
jgi:hypothetical protein